MIQRSLSRVHPRSSFVVNTIANMSSSDIPQRPLPDAEALRNFYVGKDISEVPKPAAILDVAKIRRHCSSMLETVKTLGVEFRPHVKTHKVSLGLDGST